MEKSILSKNSKFEGLKSKIQEIKKSMVEKSKVQNDNEIDDKIIEIDQSVFN